MQFRLGVVFLLFAIPNVTEACFMSYAPETYARWCPIIVVGEIVKIDDPELRTPYYFDNVQIKVDRVLKDVLKDLDVTPGKSITVKMPAASNKTVVSTDIRYPIGKRGIWLILLTKDGDLHIDRNPVQCQAIEKESDLRKAGAFTTERVATKDGKTTEVHTKKTWLDRLGKEYFLDQILDPMAIFRTK